MGHSFGRRCRGRVESTEQQASSGGEERHAREGNYKARVLLHLNLEEEGRTILVLKAFRILYKVGNIHG